MTAHAQAIGAMPGPVVMTGASDGPAFHVLHSAADQAPDAGPALVEEKNGLEATTVMSDVLPPRAHLSAERSAPTAGQVRVEGMSDHAVMIAARAARIPRVQPSEAVIVPMIDLAPVIAVNGLETIAVNVVPLPRAHPSVAQIVPVVVLVREAKANDRWMTKARSWAPFVRVIALRNPSVRPKVALALGAQKEPSLPRRLMGSCASTATWPKVAWPAAAKPTS